MHTHGKERVNTRIQNVQATCSSNNSMLHSPIRLAKKNTCKNRTHHTYQSTIQQQSTKFFLLNINQNAKIILHLLKHTDAELFCGIFAYLYLFVLPTKTTSLKSCLHSEDPDAKHGLKWTYTPFVKIPSRPWVCCISQTHCSYPVDGSS